MSKTDKNDCPLGLENISGETISKEDKVCSTLDKCHVENIRQDRGI